jgi:hypothetical protein
MPEEIHADRPDDDDYDLLTFGEAGARLIEEIAKEKRRLVALEASGEDTSAAAAIRQRITDLEAAAERQRDAAVERADFTKFFGYDPKEKA